MIKERPQQVSTIERWIKKRYGGCLLLGLILWPFVGLITQLESLLLNGLLLDTYWQIAYLTVTNVVAFFFSISILRVLSSRNPGGKISTLLFGDGEAPWGTRRIVCFALLSAVTPLFVSIWFGSEFAGTKARHVGLTILTVVVSTALGVFGLWLIGLLKCWIFGSQEESANYFPFESRTSKGFSFIAGISRAIEGCLARVQLGITDFQFFIYLVLLATAHHQLARRLESNEYWLTSAPSMLVLFMWLIFMILSGLASWLDRWRVPTLPVFVLLLTILISVHGSTRLLNAYPDNSTNKFIERVSNLRDSENKLLDNGGDIEQRRNLIAEESASLDEDAWRAVKNRMKHLEQLENSKGKTLVVVTCPGGGIHAAAWASCVLDQLSDEYVEFKDSLCVVSGVSGGSVGTLLFVGSRYENELLNRFVVGAPAPSTEDVHRNLKLRSPALELSARSSLEAIAFGATVDDLYNLVGIKGIGRGQRLEDSLNSRLPLDVQSMTIGQWGDRSLAGVVPIVIFNSTDAVTGRRILFDTIPTPQRASSVGLTARPFNYRELLDFKNPNTDALTATAARTSATFPYISPFTKPSNANDVGENCDGGYVDNEGIVTAVNWIDFFRKRWSSEGTDNTGKRTFDRILLLRIEPASVEDKNKPATPSALANTLRWLAGPGEAIVNVRSASQLERGNLETDLAALYPKIPMSDQVSIGEEKTLLGMKSNGNPAQQGQVDLPVFDKRKLSKSEIRKNWEQMLDTYQSTGKEPESALRANSPKSTVNVGDNVRIDEPPVIVQSITFVDANQTIPLNWKLSNRQKLGYLLAWELCASEGTPLRQTLDRYFNRTEKLQLDSDLKSN